MKKSLSLFLSLFIAIALWSCNNDAEEAPGSNIQKEISVTGEAIDITEFTATLCGYANVSFGVDDVTMGVIYSTNANPTLNNGVELISKEIDSNNMFMVQATDLQYNTTYYYKSFVKRGGVYYSGDVRSFTSRDFDLFVRTEDAINITEYGALLMGNVQVDSKDELSYNACFLLSDEYNELESLISNGSRFIAEPDFQFQLSHLNLNTTYYYVACVTILDKTVYGDVKSFSTCDISASVATLDATDKGLLHATLNGRISLGNTSELSVKSWFIYSKTANTLEALLDEGIDTKNGSEEPTLISKGDYLFSYSLDCCYNTTYYYVACARIQDKLFYGSINSFTTSDFTASISTNSASSVGISKATLDGCLMVENGEELSKSVWFLYSSNANDLEALKESGERVPSSLIDNGKFSFSLSSLRSNTTYYYTACARIHDKDYYGEVKSFHTRDFSIDISSIEATNIGLFNTTLSCNLHNDNEEDLFESVSFYYSCSISDPEELKRSGAITRASLGIDGSYRSVLSALIYNTQYSYIVCATVHDKKFWSEIKSFSTSDINASISTESATETTGTSAILNGRLDIENKESLTSTVWFVFSASANSLESLLSSGEMVSASLNNDGSFSAIVSSLAFKAKYYYVACAKVYDKFFYGGLGEFVADYSYTAQAVDLGLSVKWSSYNLGATSQEDFGLYYAWGEIEPKQSYTWYTYAYGKGSQKMTKYVTYSQFEPVDNLNTLLPEDDAAQMKLGGGWRMPTYEECCELIDNCTCTEITLNGVPGTQVVGPNGNSIFLPKAGCYSSSFEQYNAHYWSSSVYSSGRSENYKAWCLYNGGTLLCTVASSRYFGCSIRPVKE